MSKEKEYVPVSGYVMLVLVFIVLTLTVVLLSRPSTVWMGGLLSLSVILLPGFFFVNPNSSRVLVLFGEYKGTVKKNGIFWVNPFFSKRAISLRSRNFDCEKIKVTDKES